MRILGAVLAGGQARRFGSDKALALLDGKRLIDHVLDALRPQVAAIVVVGRDHPGEVSLPDWPGPGLGPLGGLAAALAYARARRFDAVLTSGCDLPDVPRDLAARLGTPPAVATGQPLVGLWPAALAARLDAHLAAGCDRSLRGWASAVAAREVDLGSFRNINHISDLR
ncbi:MAG: molybdenum cofactor guanylyltransferase [Sphingomonadaceae bacterium]|nr:molybdenum cofactor guanylyltransferase [Sphingomonadaceae bacterium]